MEEKNETQIISIQNLCKAFSGKVVVSDVSFDVYPGEIIGLVGENGAGKSTLKNMLCGLLKPTSGKIYIDGQEISQINPFKHGISAVHQELSLFESLTVSANLCISDLPGSPMNVNWNEADKIVKQQMEFLGIDVNPAATVETLGTGKKQVVEIAKALLHSDKVLILDEPTTSLTTPEREKLFTIMRKLKKQGVAIIFISHFMDEIMKMCDKFIVLRDGQQVGMGNIQDMTRSQIETLMVGRTISESKVDIGLPSKEEALKAENLSSCDFDKVNLCVHKGEILGLAGLIGAGRTEVAEAIFGITKSQGNVYVMGEKVSPTTVKKMKARKVAFVTEDRRTSGIYPQRSVRENLSIANIRSFVKKRFLSMGFVNESASAAKVVDDMNISIPHIESKITNLSGGNQQKVMLGRWLASNPHIVILDEPTKGVDIGAKFDIHNMIADLAKQGVAVLIVSSDLPELLTLSHRVLVMSNGHIVGEFPRNEFDPVKIISLSTSSVQQINK